MFEKLKEKAKLRKEANDLKIIEKSETFVRSFGVNKNTFSKTFCLFKIVYVINLNKGVTKTNSLEELVDDVKKEGGIPIMIEIPSNTNTDFVAVVSFLANRSNRSADNLENYLARLKMSGEIDAFDKLDPSRKLIS